MNNKEKESLLEERRQIQKKIEERFKELFKMLDPYRDEGWDLELKAVNDLWAIFIEMDEISEERYKGFMRKEVVKSAVNSFERFVDDRKAFIENYERKLEMIMRAYLEYVKDKFFSKYRKRIESVLKSLVHDTIGSLERLKRVEFEQKEKAQKEARA